MSPFSWVTRRGESDKKHVEGASDVSMIATHNARRTATFRHRRARFDPKRDASFAAYYLLIRCLTGCKHKVLSLPDLNASSGAWVSTHRPLRGGKGEVRQEKVPCLASGTSCVGCRLVPQ